MLTHRNMLAVLMLLFALPQGALGQAQEPDDSTSGEPSEVRVFGSLGLGWGSEGGAGLLALSLRTAGGDFIVRTAGTFDPAPLFGRSEDIADVALLYGRLHEGTSGWVRLAAGPSYVESRRDGDVEECVFFFCTYEEERSGAFGLALQAEGALRPRRTLGIGVSGFANVNRTYSFVGATLTLHIGRVSRSSGPPPL